jgi:hypothetical protein
MEESFEMVIHRILWLRPNIALHLAICAHPRIPQGFRLPITPYLSNHKNHMVCIKSSSPLEVHLLTMLSSWETMLEELERHTSATMVGERVLLLTLMRVVGVVPVVIPSTELCHA